MEKESITDKETEEEVARLKRLARKTHDVKLRQRYDIIRLFLCKRAKTDIAAILDISLTQVYLILNLYKEVGIEGLGLKRPTGRQRKLTDEQERELRSIITEKLPNRGRLRALLQLDSTFSMQICKRSLRCYIQ